MIKQLQFDYWPIHRSDDIKNPLIEEGSLQDLLSTYWNDVECWPTIELSKEQMDKGSVQRTADIEIKENNILNLINTQRWVQDEEQIELSYLMQLQSSNGKWKINFTLDVGDVPENDLNSFYSWSDAVNNINNSYGSGSQTKTGITQLMNDRINYILSQSEFQFFSPSVSNITLSTNSPSINSTINISADISSTTNMNYVYLGHRDSPSDIFTKTPMIDQGGGVFTASIDVESSDIEYYIYAENMDAGIFSPERAEHEFYKIPVGGNIVINEFMAL